MSWSFKETCNHSKALSFSPRQAVGLKTLTTAVRQLEELTGEEVDVEEGAIATAFKKVASEELEKLWAEHLAGEFVNKDVEETLATMVEDASVNHMPVNTGGRGKAELRVFYRDDFIPHGRTI